jgi:hypothetical protein
MSPGEGYPELLDLFDSPRPYCNVNGYSVYVVRPGGWNE